MLAPKYFREHIQQAAKALAKRGFKMDIASIEKLEKQRKELQVATQELQNQRNQRSKEIGIQKSRCQDTEAAIKAMGEVGKQLQIKANELKEVQDKLQAIYDSVPNMPHQSVTAGKDENYNQELRKWGKLPKFKFKVKDHVELGESLGLLDFKAAGKITGTRFVVINKDLARLHRALTQFMLDVHLKEHDYQEVYVPFLINAASLYGTGQLPKFRDDQFNIAGEFDYSLNPTAEVPVTNLLRGEILEAEDLPFKRVCHTTCFRSEAGSYGKDTRGMVRMHQFEKVELVQVVEPRTSYDALEDIVKHAERILKLLKLPYRVVCLCGGDMGFSAAKTYDIEVWLPGQNRYREISSCSNFEDFQARRMQMRWRNPETGKPELLHTLNGSGLPAGRTLVAIMENFQDKHGRIQVPKVLHKYMGGVKVIG